MLKGLNRVTVSLVLDVEMVGKHVGQAPNFTPAHSVGLSCYRKRTAARLADAPGARRRMEFGRFLVGYLDLVIHPPVSFIRRATDDLARLGQQRVLVSRTRYSTATTSAATRAQRELQLQFQLQLQQVG